MYLLYNESKSLPFLVIEYDTVFRNEEPVPRDSHALMRTIPDEGDLEWDVFQTFSGALNETQILLLVGRQYIIHFQGQRELLTRTSCNTTFA
jgi:hypothetical protein